MSEDMIQESVCCDKSYCSSTNVEAVEDEIVKGDISDFVKNESAKEVVVAMEEVKLNVNETVDKLQHSAVVDTAVNVVTSLIQPKPLEDKSSDDEKKKKAFLVKIEKSIRDLSCLTSSNPNIEIVLLEILHVTLSLYNESQTIGIDFDIHFFVDTVVYYLDKIIDEKMEILNTVDHRLYLLWTVVSDCLEKILKPSLHNLIRSNGKRKVEDILTEATMDLVSQQSPVSCLQCFLHILLGKK
jgi:hypothetical protein